MQGLQACVPVRHCLLTNDCSVQIFVPDGDTDDGGLYAIDILDPGTYLYIPVVNYYHLMIAQLKEQGYTPGKGAVLMQLLRI